MGFAVLLNEKMKVPLDKAAPIIAKAEHVIYADATRALRNQTGFLAKNIAQAEAEQIAVELNAIGIGCFVLDESSMYFPPDYYLLNTAILREDGFQAMDLRGNTIAFDWQNLMFISVGKILPHKAERYTLGSDSDFSQPSQYRMLHLPKLGGSIEPTAMEPKKTIEITKARFALDIFLKPPQEAHFRIFGDGFNYGYLGNRIGMASSQNFKILVDDFVRLAPHAFGNKGLDAFLGKSMPRNMEYPDQRLFDEENLWMLQIVWLNLNQ
jgi:hypothetical protein